MTLRFIDGFSHYSAAQALRKWTVFNGAISAGNGRFGSSSYRVTNDTHQAIRTIDAQATWTIGFAFRPGGLPANHWLCALYDSGAAQVSARLNADGTISLLRGASAGTVLGTSSFALSIGAWHYVELKATINNTTGAYELRVNGTARIGPASGQNTRNTANGSANQLLLGFAFVGSNNGVPADDFCDFYACDAAGTVNNTFLGDRRVETFLPNANGLTDQFALTGAASNYAAVSDNPANDDTSYVASATAGQTDLYAIANLSSTPQNIDGVQVTPTARTDDAGARVLAAEVRSGGANYAGAGNSLSVSYLMYPQVWEADPATAAPWTQAGVQGAQYGVTLTS